MTLKEIQNDVILKYSIVLCDGSRCNNDWRRTHAHIKLRRVCKWKQSSSIKATFELFHEIGHIETSTPLMRRCESEYYATVWAIQRMREYGLDRRIPQSLKRLYQEYIWRERDRGIRCGGSDYMTKEQLTLDW